MDKLIQMTDFVLQRNEINGEDYYGYEKTAVECINYAKFLKQSLTLGMFVPVDEDGNVLEEPNGFKDYLDNNDSMEFAENYDCILQYQKAKENVLFKGFNEDSARKLMYYNDNIEQLANYNLYELTPSALKAIGIE